MEIISSCFLYSEDPSKFLNLLIPHLSSLILTQNSKNNLHFFSITLPSNNFLLFGSNKYEKKIKNNLINIKLKQKFLSIKNIQLNFLSYYNFSYLSSNLNENSLLTSYYYRFFEILKKENIFLLLVHVKLDDDIYKIAEEFDIIIVRFFFFFFYYYLFTYN